MQWSYCVEEVDLAQRDENIENQLNELGDGEWEAVAVFPASSTPNRVYILLKKPKSS